FAAQDPFRVIPSIVVGSMIGSVIGMIGGVGDHVAHGGPIVAVLGAVDNVLLFVIATIIGTVVTAIMVNNVKKDLMIEAIPKGTEGMLEEDDDNKEAEEVKGKAGNEKIQATQEEINKVTDIMDESLIDTNLTGNSRDDIIGAMIGMLD